MPFSLDLELLVDSFCFVLVVLASSCLCLAIFCNQAYFWAWVGVDFSSDRLSAHSSRSFKESSKLSLSFESFFQFRCFYKFSGLVSSGDWPSGSNSLVLKALNVRAVPYSSVWHSLRHYLKIFSSFCASGPSAATYPLWRFFMKSMITLHNRYELFTCSWSWVALSQNWIPSRTSPRR